jgi:hypothetical protein
MPEIFNSPDCASRKDSFSHAFVGFIQMLQVDKRLSRYSQGSALQQKTRLISDIKERSQLASAEYLIQDSGMALTNIIQKQPSLKECTEMSRLLPGTRILRGFHAKKAGPPRGQQQQQHNHLALAPKGTAQKGMSTGKRGPARIVAALDITRITASTRSNPRQSSSSSKLARRLLKTAGRGRSARGCNKLLISLQITTPLRPRPRNLQ